MLCHVLAKEGHRLMHLHKGMFKRGNGKCNLALSVCLWLQINSPALDFPNAQCMPCRLPRHPHHQPTLSSYVSVHRKSSLTETSGFINSGLSCWSTLESLLTPRAMLLMASSARLWSSVVQCWSSAGSGWSILLRNENEMHIQFNSNRNDRRTLIAETNPTPGCTHLASRYGLKLG